MYSAENFRVEVEAETERGPREHSLDRDGINGGHPSHR